MNLADVLRYFLPFRDIVKTIDGVSSLYLRRFYLTPRAFGHRLMLHYIARSDDDRDPHDHPFAFTSLILSGGYTEELHDVPRDRYGAVLTSARGFRVITTTWHGPGSLLRRDATATHRVRLTSKGNGLGWPEEHPAWTLVLAGERVRTWGFHTRAGFVPHHAYGKAGAVEGAKVAS